MKLAIIIPAYNEQSSIAATINGIKNFGSVIVGNDCSTDATAEVASANGAQVITGAKNSGYEGALNLGFSEALRSGFTHAITFDADGQHPAEKIPTFLAAFESGNILVLGRRPNTQRWSEAVFALYTKLRYGVSDPLCGMKGYDLRAWPKQRPFDSNLTTGTEMMIRYLASGAKFVQIPIDIAERADQPRFGSSWRANKKILKSLFKIIQLQKNLTGRQS